MRKFFAKKSPDLRKIISDLINGQAVLTPDLYQQISDLINQNPQQNWQIILETRNQNGDNILFYLAKKTNGEEKIFLSNFLVNEAIPKVAFFERNEAQQTIFDILAQQNNSALIVAAIIGFSYKETQYSPQINDEIAQLFSDPTNFVAQNKIAILQKYIAQIGLGNKAAQDQMSLLIQLTKINSLITKDDLMEALQQMPECNNQQIINFFAAHNVDPIVYSLTKGRQDLARFLNQNLLEKYGLELLKYTITNVILPIYREAENLDQTTLKSCFEKERQAAASYEINCAAFDILNAFNFKQKIFQNYRELDFLEYAYSRKSAVEIIRTLEEIKQQKTPIELVFIHTINTGVNSITGGSGLFSKLGGNDIRNINATLIELNSDRSNMQELPKINIYAHTRYKGYPSLIFDSDVMMLGYWPANINSSSYNFGLNPKLQYPQRIHDMGAWQGEYAYGQKIQPYRYKFSIRSAARKNREIKAAVEAVGDNSKSTRYYNYSGEIIVDRRNKFFNQQYLAHEIPQKELRHNECHIKASWSNVRDIALVKTYSTDSIAEKIGLLQIISLKERINQQRNKILNDANLMQQEIEFHERKKENLKSAIQYLTEKIAAYRTDLTNVGKDFTEYNFNKDLTESFERKTKKFPKFAVFDHYSQESEAKENRRQWLKNNIKKNEIEIANLLLELDLTSKITPEKIKEKLRKPVGFKFYNKEKAILENADYNFTSQELVNSIITEFNESNPKDFSILHKMIAAQIDIEAIKAFLNHISEEDKKCVLQAQFNEGNLLLSTAECGFLEAAELLCRDYDFKPRKKDLMSAIRNEHLDLAKFLCEQNKELKPEKLTDYVIDLNCEKSAEFIFEKALESWPKTYPEFAQKCFDTLFKAVDNKKFNIAKNFLETMKKFLVPVADDDISRKFLAFENPLFYFPAHNQDFKNRCYKEFLTKLSAQNDNYEQIEFILNNNLLPKEQIYNDIYKQAAEKGGIKMFQLFLDHKLISSKEDIESGIAVIEKSMNQLIPSASLETKVLKYENLRQQARALQQEISC